jgi:transposase
MEPYPRQLRKRIIELYEQGQSTKHIAQWFGICRSGVRRVRQHFRERGTLEPLARDPGREQGLSDAEQRRLAEQVKAKPDATLAELRASLGVAVALSTMDRALRRLGLSRKKRRGMPRSRSGRM